MRREVKGWEGKDGEGKGEERMRRRDGGVRCREEGVEVRDGEEGKEWEGKGWVREGGDRRGKEMEGKERKEWKENYRELQ